MKDEVKNFIVDLFDGDSEFFPYLYNNDYEKGESNIFYSGPYWDHEEIEAAVKTFLTGKWLSSGEQVNKFEKEFSKKFNFDYSVMVNSGSSANLVMIAALKKYFGWE
jgi:CDP-6-deoxy-D-xylo-4-hexulose-3-dehydrase